MQTQRLGSLLLALTLLAGCDADVGPDASVARDASAATDGETSIDGGAIDGGATDAATEDGGAPDAGAPSEGCGRAADIAEGEWVAQTLDVGGVTRDWFVWLPEGYDPARAYPVVYQFHGCSDRAERERNNVPVERESGQDAIHVRGRAVDRCWVTGAAGPDVAFFDAMVGAVEERFCADPDRRFATGYSSGAFMSHQLACVRGDVLRGVATIGGGQAGRDCSGIVGALLIHDQDDGTVRIRASEGARDAHVDRNGCAADTAPTDPAPCVAYADCAEPVVWCETAGMGHSRQDAFAAPAFWGFLSTLP